MNDQYAYFSTAYCSYIYGTKAMGPTVKIWWYQGENIDALAEIETETGLKVFPRYILYDPIEPVC
jgi:hypothetical protein